jgi:hypothetical protein
MTPGPANPANMPRPRAASAAWWLLPSLLCLALYWRGFTAWFRADDFAWLGAGIYVRNFHDLLVALFAPQAQGTIRPLSERAFFMAGFSLFGLDALPFRSSFSTSSPIWRWLPRSVRGSPACARLASARAFCGCSTGPESSRWAGPASITK